MKKLTNEFDLVGQVVRGVYDTRYGGGKVIVFESNDWCVFDCVDACNDDASVSLDHYSTGYHGDVKEFMTPFDLLEAQLLSKEQHDFLVEQQRQEQAAKQRKHAEALLREADELLSKKSQ